MRRWKAEAVFALLTVILSAGCGSRATLQQNSYEQALVGKWAYAHDPDTMVARFQQNGDATFEGDKYTYTCDGTRIHLIDPSGKSLDLRYVQKENQMYVYIRSTYTRESADSSDGIVGVWRCQEKNWTYEFTDKGTFMEDGALTGYYLVDEQAGTVKLMYGEALEDTVFYYQLAENELLVEYPWLMNKMKE